MRRLLINVVTCAVVAGGTIVLAHPAAASPRTSSTTTTEVSATSSSARFSTLGRFAREKTVRGDQDTSPTNIDHVIELQLRLRWAGVYHGHITGYFGDQTKKAVKTFQRRRHLTVNGKATHATWYKLIKHTIRGRKAIPKSCQASGWHACYDRSRHQVTLFHSGRLHNSWLVRGGDTQYKTRTGRYRVFLRSRHHVSSVYKTPMPYAQFFSGGQALHASYFMVNPFVGHSHGCVNMYIKDARQLWRITAGKRLYVTVYGSWD